MDRDRNLLFDPKVFLSKVNGGQATSVYRNGQTVYTQGERADSVFYIQNGNVKKTVVSEQGKEAVVAVLGTGAFFGEGCLSGQPRRLATVSAMEECVIVRITKAEITRVIHEEPAFAELFIAHLLARNERVEGDLIDQLFNSSEKRLARILLLLANFGKEGRPEPIAAKISQETLAEMIGTTRSRVSFFMNKFRELGFIDYNGHIEVHSSLLNVVLREKPEINEGWSNQCGNLTTLDDKGGFRAVFSFSWQQGENRSHRHAPAVAASAFDAAGSAGFPLQQRVAVVVYYVAPILTALAKCVDLLKCVSFRNNWYDLSVLVDTIQSIGFGGLALNFQRSSPAFPTRIDNMAWILSTTANSSADVISSWAQAYVYCGASVEQFCTAGWRQSASSQSRPFGCGRGSRQAGPQAEVSGFQSPDPGFPHDFLKHGRSEKENNMDWNAIFFAVALPLFVFGAIGMGVYVQRLPG
jgi:CRP/FNR family cyclic AMP-dependent transcriptional regulator